jgi:hypothetical protein
LKAYRWKGKGRKRKNHISMAKAFIAKAIYNFETTDILIDYLKGCKNIRRLCGWENPWQVPSKSTFSRAFAQFSQGHLTQNIHEAMVKEHCGEKLAGHNSRDATAIAACERPMKKKADKSVTQPKRKPGRPRKGEVVAPNPPKRLDLQPTRTLEDNLKDLPTHCDVGTKKKQQGL